MGIKLTRRQQVFYRRRKWQEFTKHPTTSHHSRPNVHQVKETSCSVQSSSSACLCHTHGHRRDRPQSISSAMRFVDSCERSAASTIPVVDDARQTCLTHSMKDFGHSHAIQLRAGNLVLQDDPLHAVPKDPPDDSSARRSDLENHPDYSDKKPCLLSPHRKSKRPDQLFTSRLPIRQL